MQPLNSQITSVTVFPDQATVTRVAKLSLTAGESTLVFDQLPNSIIEKSIQLRGFGKAMLGTIKIEKVPYLLEPNLNRAELLLKMQALSDDLKVIDDKILRLGKERSLIDSIAQKITSPLEGSEPASLEPERWTKMLAFYKEKLEGVDNQLGLIEKDKRILTKQLDQLKLDIERTGVASPKKIYLRISTLVTVSEAGEIELELSYTIPGARWYPVYDIRVSSDKKMNISYQAMVAQTTTENWDNTALTLSTANPKVSGTLPELYPWYLEPDFHDYEAPSTSRAAKLAAPSAGSGSGLAAMDEMLKSSTVTVKPGATAASFVVAGTHIIPSDGSEQKLTIISESFDSEFNYTAIPSRRPFAFLTAKARNSTEFPFLPGDVNVFLDGDFITTTKLLHVAPTEEFSLSLGIDESFKIKFVPKEWHYREGGNVFSKKTVIRTHDDQIKIRNHKKTAEEITVKAQVAVSKHEQIKVLLLEPSIRESSGSIKKDEFGIVEWLLRLQPGEEVTLTLKFTVEFPVEWKDRMGW